MSIPTFNGIALCSAAAAETIHSPEVRLGIETMPGVDGEFVQTHGHGGRDIEVRGVLHATGDTPAEAHQNLKALMLARGDLADGATVADYTGTDAAEYANCVLASYQAEGHVRLAGSSGGYKALVTVTAKIRQLVP